MTRLAKGMKPKAAAAKPPKGAHPVIVIAIGHMKPKAKGRK